MMETLEADLAAEIKKNHNLLRMNKSLMEENQAYEMAFQSILNFCKENQFYSRTQQNNQLQENISPDQIEAFVQQFLKNCSNKRPLECECEKWKNLYAEQGQQCLKLSQLNSQINEKQAEFQKQQESQRNGLQKILDDYLSLFKKQYNKEENREQKITERKTSLRRNNHSSKKHERNEKNDKSSAVSKQQQHSKLLANYELGIKKLGRDLQQLGKQLVSKQEQIIQKQVILKRYRMKERSRLLNLYQ